MSLKGTFFVGAADTVNSHYYPSHECGSFVIGHLDPENVRGSLLINPVELGFLVGDFAIHVTGHVAQVPNHRANLFHVLLHLILTIIIRDLRGKLANNTVRY